MAAECPVRVGPFKVIPHVLGYESITAEAYAIRVGSSPDLRQYVRLRKLAQGFGTVRVQFRATDSSAEFRKLGARDALTGEPRARVRLIPDDGADPSRSLDILWWDFGQSLEVPGIPYGNYRAYLHLPLGASPVKKGGTPLSVEIGGTASVEFDLPEWAGIDVVPSLVSGASSIEYSGSLLVDLRFPKDGRNGFATWEFDGPPYRIVGVAPGKYFVRCRRGSYYAPEEVEVAAPAGSVVQTRSVMNEVKGK